MAGTLQSGVEIAPDFSDAVHAALERLGRAEDVTFSPSGHRLALAGFERSVIAIADVRITADGDGAHVTVTGVTELESPRLTGPHGLCFVDDETIVVANRGGDVALFRLPSGGADVPRPELTPIDLPARRGFELLDGPSEVTIARGTDSEIELLVCNNHNDTVTRHVLQVDGRAPQGVTVNEVLLRQHLDLPDGVTVSPDGVWIAVSNHNRHRVMLYERSPSLRERSDPDGILRGTWCPHGLRFSADGCLLFVADAEAPFVHIYSRDVGEWRGVEFQPAASLRVMDDDTFQRGRGPGQGGPKGVDIDHSGCVLVVTSAHKPLAFFDVAAIHERIRRRRPDGAQQLRCELDILDRERLAEARARQSAMLLSRLKRARLAKPLRDLKAAWSRVFPHVREAPVPDGRQHQ
jgi:hypothetical protein